MITTSLAIRKPKNTGKCLGGDLGLGPKPRIHLKFLALDQVLRTSQGKQSTTELRWPEKIPNGFQRSIPHYPEAKTLSSFT